MIQCFIDGKWIAYTTFIANKCNKRTIQLKHDNYYQFGSRIHGKDGDIYWWQNRVLE